jgi:hypothetical protein
METRDFRDLFRQTGAQILFHRSRNWTLRKNDLRGNWEGEFVNPAQMFGLERDLEDIYLAGLDAGYGALNQTTWEKKEDLGEEVE